MQSKKEKQPIDQVPPKLFFKRQTFNSSSIFTYEPLTPNNKIRLNATNKSQVLSSTAAQQLVQKQQGIRTHYSDMSNQKIIRRAQNKHTLKDHISSYFYNCDQDQNDQKIALARQSKAQFQPRNNSKSPRLQKIDELHSTQIENFTNFKINNQCNNQLIEKVMESQLDKASQDKVQRENEKRFSSNSSRLTHLLQKESNIFHSDSKPQEMMYYRKEAIQEKVMGNIMYYQSESKSMLNIKSYNSGNNESLGYSRQRKVLEMQSSIMDTHSQYQSVSKSPVPVPEREKISTTNNVQKYKGIIRSNKSKDWATSLQFSNRSQIK